MFEKLSPIQKQATIAFGLGVGTVIVALFIFR